MFHWLWLCFFQWHFIDLFSCIATNLFNQLTYLSLVYCNKRTYILTRLTDAQSARQRAVDAGGRGRRVRSDLWRRHWRTGRSCRSARCSADWPPCWRVSPATWRRPNSARVVAITRSIDPLFGLSPAPITLSSYRRLSRGLEAQPQATCWEYYDSTTSTVGRWALHTTATLRRYARLLSTVYLRKTAGETTGVGDV